MKFHEFYSTGSLIVLKSIFKSLSQNNVENILSKSNIKIYQKGELILNKENCTNALYILLDGIIQIGYLSPSGRFHAFNYYSEKNVINLLPCLHQQKIDYDYYAFNQVRVLVVPKQIIQDEFNNNKDLAQDVISVISVRMYYLINEIKFLQVASLHQKVCNILLNLARQYGISHALGTEIKLKISQHDLADLLSSSRQTVHKEIKSLVSMDVICWQYENIIIKDLKYFEMRVSEV